MVFLCLWFFIIFIIFSHSSTILTKKLYVSLTYTYVLNYFLWMYLIILIMKKYFNEIMMNVYHKNIILLCVLFLISTSLIIVINQKYQFFIHVLWFLNIVLIWTMIFPFFNLKEYNHIVKSAITWTIVLLYIMSYIWTSFDGQWMLGYGYYLIIGVLSIIIYELCAFIYDKKNYTKIHIKYWG